MKVAIIVPVFCTGGAENMAAQLAVNLDRSQVDVEVISMYPRQGHIFEKKIEDAGIPIHYMDKQGHASLGAMGRLWKCLSIMKPDIIHVHMYSVFYAIPWIAFHKATMVRTIHIQPDQEFTPFLRWALHSGARMGKIFPVAISKANREQALALYHCSEKLYPYVNNPVELEKYYHRKQDGTPVTFIAVGRLEERKNQVLIIHALPEVIRQAGDVKLILLGDGEMKEFLVQEAERLGVSHSVEFAGNQSNPQDYLAVSDVFVSASHMEGLPLSVLEGMASGLPVISTDVGAMRDLVQGNGTLIMDNDLEALIREMVRFALAPELRQRCGEKSREMVKAYDAESCARAYTEIYRKLSGS